MKKNIKNKSCCLSKQPVLQDHLFEIPKKIIMIPLFIR